MVCGVLSVDVFFFLSGFLVAYLFLQELLTKRGAVHIAKVYFHRYYRLVFPIAAITMFASTLYRYIGSGPLWSSFSISFSYQCETTWWNNLLFIQNVYPWTLEEECVAWVWYLAIDMQLFLVTPFVV